jgi:hypothetical protein
MNKSHFFGKLAAVLFNRKIQRIVPFMEKSAMVGGGDEGALPCFKTSNNVVF